jgi:hypothetical protein
VAGREAEEDVVSGKSFKANVTYYITIERWCGRNWRKYGGDGGMAYSSFIDVSALGGIGGQG